MFLGAEGSNEPIFIGANLYPNKKTQLHVLLKEYKDVFPWKYTNLRRILEHITQDCVGAKDCTHAITKLPFGPKLC